MSLLIVPVYVGVYVLVFRWRKPRQVKSSVLRKSHAPLEVLELDEHMARAGLDEMANLHQMEVKKLPQRLAEGDRNSFSSTRSNFQEGRTLYFAHKGILDGAESIVTSGIKLQDKSNLRAETNETDGVASEQVLQLSLNL